MVPAAPPAPGLVSIIVPCHNGLEFTRTCIASVVRHSRPPWELILVDNGSTDDSPAYFLGVKDASPGPITILTNPENRGFPAAINQGLMAASGEYLVLLNNDTVVTDAWLDQFIALADANPSHGLVGPMSNYVAPPQKVDVVPYRTLDEMHRFASRWRLEHRGRWFAAERISGFCLLLKRRVLDAIGGLDERFGLGLFDDNDLCLRARKAGFELAVAQDLFIHHFGSRTFTAAGVDVEALLAENQGRFEAKWGAEAPTVERVTVIPWTGRAESTPKDLPRPKVSLTMIVKNEESNLPACLGSVKGLFDEIMIVDTGSTDRTVEIARSFGARVFDFVWVDDFAAARNAALARATGDYAFWLDADDVLDPPERARLEALFAGLRPNDEAAYVVRCACEPEPDGSGGRTVVDHMRLFPVREDVRWSYAVHEQILPALRKVGIPVRWTDVTVRHTGYVDPEVRQRKLQRDERILMRELEDQPSDPFILFNLGSIAVERNDWATALRHLEKSLAGSAPSDSITRKLHALIAKAHQMTGNLDRALEACGRGLEIDPEDAELTFRMGILHRARGESDRAEACWKKVLTLRRPEKFSSVDAGIYGHLTRRNLAVLAEERGDRETAIGHLEAVLAECPGDPDATVALDRLRRGDAGGILDDGWLVAGSARMTVRDAPDEDFAPYAPGAIAWCRALNARVVVALGMRFDGVARALVDGTAATEGRVWGVDPLERHSLADPRFTFLRADPLTVADRWERIDLLHVDTDANDRRSPSRWVEAYADRCRAIALRNTHHPIFGTGLLVRALAATGRWRVFESRGPQGGWTVLVRPGEPTPMAEPLS